MSLRWNLLIPLIILSFLGTASLVSIAYVAQKKLVEAGERQVLENTLKRFQELIANLTDRSIIIAQSIALDTNVRDSMERRDREGLLSHLASMFEELRDHFGLVHIHFHLPPGISFLRVHSPNKHGDLLTPFRPDVIYVLKTGQRTGGLWKGSAGYGIRGIVPIIRQGEILGSVEVGFSLDGSLLRDFKERTSCDVTVYGLPSEEGDEMDILASTIQPPPLLSMELAGRLLSQGGQYWIGPSNGGHFSEILGVLPGPLGQVSALISLRKDRAAVEIIVGHTMRNMLVIGGLGLLASALLLWILVDRFLKPVREMVGMAQQVASGERLQLPLRGTKETVQLSRALNSMVGYLEASRERTREYARNLEREVEKRTKELRASEERYRSLLERLPLVVYEMTPERRITFVSSFCREMLGVDPESLMETEEGFDAFVPNGERERLREGFLEAMTQGRTWEAQYRMWLPDGRGIWVMEQATPVKDRDGRIAAAEGILTDITLNKRLSEMTLQAEEVKTLAEVSSRLAHEIRNPLTSIGGLSRRMLKELNEGHPCKVLAQAIAREVQRLEGMLQMMLTYIQPLELELSYGDIGDMAQKILEDLAPEFRHKGMDLIWEVREGMPLIPMDSKAMERALEILFRHPLFRMKEGSALEVKAFPDKDRATVRVSYVSSSLAPDDMEHYFYPFLAQESPDPSLLELPVARNIFFRHGALVTVDPGPVQGQVIIEVSLPCRAQ